MPSACPFWQRHFGFAKRDNVKISVGGLDKGFKQSLIRLKIKANTRLVAVIKRGSLNRKMSCRVSSLLMSKNPFSSRYGKYVFTAKLTITRGKLLKPISVIRQSSLTRVNEMC